MAKQLLPDARADIVPKMSAEDYAALKADIAANGQLVPIDLYEGRIIDGRSRYQACCELGIEPKTRVAVVNGSPTAFALSMNLPRRHLTPGQKAAVATEALPYLEAEAKERMKQGGAKGGKSKGNQKVDTPSVRKPQAIKQAAKAAGTNPQYVADAKALKKASPAVFEKLRQGELSIPEAKREVARERAKQGLPASKTPHQQAHESPGRRWSASLHKLYVFMTSTRDLGGIKKLAVKWTANERKEYVAELKRIVGEMNKWVQILEEA